MTDMIAALYVQTGGVYFGLPNVDPWDETRDARMYPGPWPVVAHPPCSRWCQLARVNEKRWGARVGDDGGCFAAALASVRDHGGVLEHPAESLAWPFFGLLRPPRRGGWQFDAHDGSWTCEVQQAAYGHPARKRTWLYFVGQAPPAPLHWHAPPPTAWIGNDGSPGAKRQLGKREASASPVAFRDALLSLADLARGAAQAVNTGGGRA